ncbi:MAG: hypothetical protein JW751_16895 [Polyangiaceae bacterium]|nr:hypothetical protein [Polyangiaceae bacterium]
MLTENWAEYPELMQTRRLSDLTPRHIEVTDEHGGETARRFRAEPGELWLLDRGYANPRGVAAIYDRSAHLIVRDETAVPAPR